MVYGKITGYNGAVLQISAPFTDSWLLEKQGISEVEIRLLDGRYISADQRKKAYALFRDISAYSGHLPDEIKELLKADYIAETGAPYFSLSSCDMTTARQFISHIIEFCLLHDIPCSDTLLERTDDIARYLYLCLVHRKCCLCGRRAHIHHVDRIGVGADRKEVCHEGYRAMALCWRHHNEAHNCSAEEFNHRYHVFGVALDSLLCKKHKLGRYA